ncbi:MAG: stage II sporulation protein E, partial [Phycisphaerae bacterium]|nr:stage II sporulation protein E [Phycisphaerae bacterium]
MSQLLVDRSESAVFQGTWEQRLEQVRQMMLEMSLQTDPQAMVERYGTRVRKLMQYDGLVAVSRRGVAAPRYKITRSHLWGLDFDPWRNADRLPVLQGGILGQLLYAGLPKYLPELHVEPDDPAAEHLAGMGSLFAMPAYDAGKALSMTILMRRQPDGFDRERLPEQLWLSGLFGRVTHNLLLSRQLKEAYEAVDRELK